jgi:PAS domain S-box-containing protein
MRQKAKILVVDHDRLNLDRISQTLSSAGYEVFQTERGCDVLASSRQHDPDLLLLRTNLPDITSSEVCQRLKADSALAKILVVYLASEHVPKNGPNESQLGADHSIPCGVDGDELLERVAICCRQQRAEAALHREAGRLSALIATQQEIAAAAPDPTAIMKLVAARAQQLTGAAGAVIELVEGDEMVYRAASGITASQLGLRFNVSASFSGLCVQTEEILRCDDVKTDLRLAGDASHLSEVRSVVAVPLKQQYNSMGVLKVVALTPKAFGEGDLQMLQLVAHFMAVAINQAVALGAKQALLAEHTRTILALRESEERFRSAFDYAAIGMALVGTDGRWMKVNHPLCEIVGYAQEELLARSVQDFIHPEDLEAGGEHVRQLLTGDTRTYQTELRFVHKSGSVVWILLNISLLRNSQGKPLYFIAQIQDITERKRAEETKARLTAILEATTDFIGTLDVDGRTLYLNRAFREVVGIGANDTLDAKHISEYHPPWAADVIASDGFPTAIREGTWSGEIALLNPAGREIPISQVIIAHKTPKGQVAYFSTVARDITERKRAEEALIMQARVLQNMSEGVCLADENGFIVYTNAAEEKMFAYGPAELIGQHVTILNHYPLEESARLMAEINEHVATKGAWSGEFKNRGKDGRPFTTSSSISLLEISGRKYLVYVQEDITEKKRADEQIKNSLIEKDVLLKEIHHRVKNNLQVISSLLNLQSRYIQDDRTHELFRESQNRVRSMALIHEKLYQSQDLAKVDFAEYVLSLASMLFRSYGTNSGAVKLDLAVDPVFLSIDTAIPVGLVINELVSNSLKYAFPNGRPGTISIDFHTENDDQFSLVFRDDGIGVPEEFDLDKAPSLGLRLVKILTGQLGGKLAFRRTGGTEFKITFKEQKEKDRK